MLEGSAAGQGETAEELEELFALEGEEGFEEIPAFRTVFTLAANMDGHVAAPEESVGQARFGLMLEVQSLIDHALTGINREHPGLMLGVVDMQVREIPQ
jgi:hypothetical protein